MFHCGLLIFVPVFSQRINKKGSQKDAEQKASGNYFFYDNAEDDDSDFDDDDLWKKLRQLALLDDVIKHHYDTEKNKIEDCAGKP